MSSMKPPVNPKTLAGVGSSEACELACLNNCSCTTYSYSSGGCSVWYEDSLDLQEQYNRSNTSTLHLRLAMSELRSSNSRRGQGAATALSEPDGVGGGGTSDDEGAVDRERVTSGGIGINVAEADCRAVERRLEEVGGAVEEHDGVAACEVGAVDLWDMVKKKKKKKKKNATTPVAAASTALAPLHSRRLRRRIHPHSPATTFTPRAFSSPFSRCFRWATPRSGGGWMDHATMSPPDVAVRDPELLEKKKAAIRSAGPSKLQVIADFDGTLTRYWIDGRRGQTSHGLLQQGNAEYDAKRQALYEYYHPLEISATIPIEEKTKLMEEWWEKTHGLLIEGGLTYDAIKRSVSEATIAFRDGVVELFEFLEERGVPVLVFSAGLADIIEEVFRQKLHRSFENIKVVSNRMVFDEQGHLVAFKGKTIHVLNKNEHSLDMASPIHDKFGDPNGYDPESAFVKKHTNVLLLGDHIGDLGMSDGLSYENRIAVGFLNNYTETALKSYLDAFDIVYLNDASMGGVVELASQLCGDNP
ncbi:7-methylguanosine phosphate-specific 5'-nucleotidase A [Canna indica]|uniref:5'-nucleotidase n=1 Tax=Canna indica TaxID=4628 RepID=A0AAQ3KFI9_9LILI|nr:7-methylguanosine phosphate-specific 5'-nucleotidase A [Canna indica]